MIFRKTVIYLGKILFLFLNNPYASCMWCDMFLILALIFLRQKDCHSYDGMLDNIKRNRIAKYRYRTCLK